MVNKPILLKDLVRIKGGKRLPKGSVLQPERNSHPYIRVRDMGDRYVPRTGLEYVPDNVFPSIQRYIVEKNDVIVSIVGTIGLVSIIDSYFHKASQTENCAKLTGLNRSDSHYLYYYLVSPYGQHQISLQTVGAVQAKLPLYGLGNIPVPWPGQNTRESMVDILGSIDDKIHLNHQINQTLESVAQTIFKSWFVDFDPVKAKLEGREPEGMDAETAALFPDRLAESELGLIPEGWEIKSLSGVATFLNGLALQKYPATEGEPYYPVLKIAELRSGFGARTNRANTDVPNDYIVQDGDIIFSWSGSLLVKQWSLGEAALNQHLFKVTSDSYPKWFYYQWVLHHLPEFQSIAAGKATTMGHIQRKHLDEAKVLVPSQDLMRSADSLIHTILEMQLNNDLTSRTLSNLRDVLLPKLISGEIQIPTE